MGIIAQWSDFTAEEDENDQVVDLTGNGNTGILHDDVSLDLIGARGRILNFSGSPADVRVPDSATVSPTAALSVGAWVFKTDTDQAMIVDKDQAYRLWIPLNDNVPCFNVYCSGAWYEFQGTFTIPTNQWVFLQGGYDSATKTVQLYLQGSLKTEDTNFDRGVVADNALQVYFGRYSPGGYQFSGYIGEVVIRDNLIDLATHRTDLKRWLKRRAGRVIEFLELHIGGEVAPILITTQHEEVTATVYDVLGVTVTTTTTTTSTTSSSSTVTTTTSPPEWTEVEDTTEKYIYSLCVFGSYIYAGTGSNGKIFRSSDGTTWIEVKDTTEGHIYSLCVFDGYIYAGTGDGGKIFRSSDGTTWTEVEDTTEKYIYSLCVFDGYIYAGTGDGGKIFRSSDGTTWTEVEDTTEIRILALCVFDGYIYAGTGSNGKIFRSSDGTTWTEAEDTTEDYIRSLCVFDGYIYAGDGGKIFRSSNGTTWTEVEETTEDYIYSLCVFGSYIYAGTGSNGKIYRSPNGTTWIEIKDTTETQIRSLCVFGSYIYAGTYPGGKIFRSDG